MTERVGMELKMPMPPTQKQILDRLGERGLMRPWMMPHEHDKDTLCLICFNHRLVKMSWTYVPGERTVKVGRYVLQRQGRFTMRKARTTR